MSNKRPLRYKAATIGTAAALGAILSYSAGTQITHMPPAHAASQTSYYAVGPQMYDNKGNPIVLLGANIESSFIYLKNWQSGKSPFIQYADPTFQVMNQDWHMNTLRMSIARGVYNSDKQTYMNDVTQVVQNANAHGLFVILNLHDDNKSGSLFPSPTPTELDIPFWQDFANHFKNYPMVGYDLFNEPHWVNAGSQADWGEWLNGGAKITDSNGQTYQEVGLKQLVSAVRTISPTQPIVVEPGDASGKGDNSEGGWATFQTSYILNYPNLMYSEHEYSGVAQGVSYQNSRWSVLLGKYPLFYGEWAVLPNSYQGGHCQGMNPGNADQIANTFMANAVAIGANFTAWDFAVPHEIVNTTSYTPTTMGTGTNWTCPAPPNTPVGMGQDLKNFLVAFKQPRPSPSPSPNPSSSPTPAPNPTPGPSPNPPSSGNVRAVSTSGTSNKPAGNNQQDTGIQAITDATLTNPLALAGAVIAGALVLIGMLYFFVWGYHRRVIDVVWAKLRYLSDVLHRRQ